MSKMIVVYPMECVGCRTCEMVCSLVHHGVCSPSLSSIRVMEWMSAGLTVPFTCLHCEKAICIEVCPVKAIYRDESSGAVVLAEERCIGCKMCVLACPLGGPKMNQKIGKMIKCDLCDGVPKCVENCPTHAIRFMDVNEFAMEKKKTAAGSLVKDELNLLFQIATDKE